MKQQSGKALDVPKNMTHNVVHIQQWDYWGGTHQQWRHSQACSFVPFTVFNDYEQNSKI